MSQRWRNTVEKVKKNVVKHKLIGFLNQNLAKLDNTQLTKLIHIKNRKPTHSLFSHVDPQRLLLEERKRGHCLICLDSLKYKRSKPVVQLPCDHFFHRECVQPLRPKLCPACRQPFTARELKTVEVKNRPQFVTKIGKNRLERIKKRLRELVPPTCRQVWILSVPPALTPRRRRLRRSTAGPI